MKETKIKEGQAMLPKRTSTLKMEGSKQPKFKNQTTEESLRENTTESNQKKTEDHVSSLNNSKIEIEGALPHSPRK